MGLGGGGNPQGEGAGLRKPLAEGMGAGLGGTVAITAKFKGKGGIRMDDIDEGAGQGGIPLGRDLRWTLGRRWGLKVVF